MSAVVEKINSATKLKLKSIPINTPVMRVFMETHMALQHKGLTEMAKSAGIVVDKLQAQEYAVFINGSCTAAKAFTANNTFAYIRQRNGLTLENLENIPSAFGGKRLRFSDKQKREIIAAINGDN